MKIKRAVQVAMVVVFLCGSAFAQQAPPPASGASSVDKDVLDPTASLMSFGFREIVTTNYYGKSGSSNQIQFQPAVPFKAWGTANILRVSLPFNTGGVAGRGLADVTVFNVTVFPTTGGRFAIGPVMNFVSNPAVTTDRFQAGPAIGWVGGKGKWTYGLFSQNLFSRHTQITALQPILAYNIGNGWALATGDAQWTIDWDSGQFVNIPIGIQVGKIFKLGSQLCRWTINPEYNARSVPGTPHWTVRFNFILLVPAK